MYVTPVTPLAATVVGGDEVPSSTVYELTVQFAGGGGAVQLKLTELEVVAVTVNAVGAEVAAVQEGAVPPRTSIPIIRGWFAVPSVKAITICPELLAVAVNDCTLAVYCAPAVL